MFDMENAFIDNNLLQLTPPPHHPGRRFMYETQSSTYCNCFYCMLNSEWREDREEMMEAEKKKEYIRDYHEATAKCVLSYSLLPLSSYFVMCPVVYCGLCWMYTYLK